MLITVRAYLAGRKLEFLIFIYISFLLCKRVVNVDWIFHVLFVIPSTYDIYIYNDT